MNTSDNSFYVYIHIRLDNSLPFYIGKGKAGRAFSKCGRNKYWTNVVNKHGYEVRIADQNLTEEEAFEFERQYIKLFRLLDYPLTNMTDGGDGASGAIRSAETRAKISAATIGKLKSAETKARMSKPKTKEHIANTSKAHFKPVECSNGMKFNSVKEAAEWITGTTNNGKTVVIKGSNISRACIGTRKTAYGYTWKYIKGETN